MTSFPFERLSRVPPNSLCQTNHFPIVVGFLDSESLRSKEFRILTTPRMCNALILNLGPCDPYS